MKRPRDLLQAAPRWLLRRPTRERRFRLRDASVGGRGLQAPFREGDWRRIREASYRER